MPIKTTANEDIQHAADVVKTTLAAAGPATKIDWTNVRKLLAQLLEKWGPVILPMIIGLLTPNEDTETTTPPKA